MITVRELIEVSPRFVIRVNGTDYDTDKDHYADDWIVECQVVFAYAYTFTSTCEPDQVMMNTFYLDISAEEPEYND